MQTTNHQSLTTSSYSTPVFPTWCPGCGDFGIWGSLKQALVQKNLAPYQFLTVFGIGCSGNMASFLHCYGIHSLHGRSLPNAVGAKLANHNLPILVVGGDGDQLGEGLNHFIQTARANHDITLILHNNLVYGLTQGQASPSSQKGFKVKATPPSSGVIDNPINPAELAISQEAGFVARGFAGDMPHLTQIIVDAINHKGFSLVEVLQPCVTFNKVNTYDWFRERIKKLDTPVTDKLEGIRLAQWTNTIYTGVIYKNDRPAFHEQLPQLKNGTLQQTTGKARDISGILNFFR